MVVEVVSRTTFVEPSMMKSCITNQQKIRNIVFGFFEDLLL